MSSVTPFTVQISDEELDLLNKKVALARLPVNIADSEWGEENGLTFTLMRDTVEHWRTSYDWRAEEANINEMPQFKTPIKLEGTSFDAVDLHFVHAKGKASPSSGGCVPLLFLHGWPGSFIEVQPMLDTLLSASFDVVAPSLPGFGFSSLPRQKGYNMYHVADTMHRLMLRLGYEQYGVQGGDWGSVVGRIMAIKYPDHVKALHLNMLLVLKPPALEPGWEAECTPFELAALGRAKWFRAGENAYQQVHASKPRTLGYALHDSPVGMLAWMADKLLVWSDVAAKTWRPAELITFALMQYFPGPTTGMEMYREAVPPPVGQLSLEPGQVALGNRVGVPVGVSAFAKEVVMVPRKWAELENNVVWWREHEHGGHFAAYERPAEMAADVIEFFGAQWRGVKM